MKNSGESKRPDRSGRARKAKLYHWQPSGGGLRFAVIRLPQAVRVAVLAAALCLAAAFVVIPFWRDVVIHVLGARAYWGLVERQNFTPVAGSAAALLSSGKPGTYNSYDLTGTVKIEGADTGLPKNFGGYALDLTQAAANSSFTLKVGENRPGKSLVAGFDWQYKGASLLSAQGYINKDTAAVSLPALLKQPVLVKAGEAPAAAPVFTLAEELCSQKKTAVRQQTVAKALGGILKPAVSAVKSGGVTVERNALKDVGGKKIRCDVITVRLTQAQLRAMLHGVLTAAGNSNEVQAVLANYAPLIHAMHGASAGGDDDIYSYAGLSQAIDRLKTGNVVMTLLVKTGRFGSQIVSREIKTASGTQLALTCIDGVGTVAFRRLDDKDGDINALSISFSTAAASVSGSATVTKAMAQKDVAAGKLNFSFGMTKAGLPTGAFHLDYLNCVTVDQAGLSLDVKPAGGKTGIVLVRSAAGKPQLTVSLTLQGSAGTLAVPAIDLSAGLDPVAQPDKLGAAAYEYGENLIGIANKLGLGPAS